MGRRFPLVPALALAAWAIAFAPTADAGHFDGCGDGVVQALEQCDDGNTTDCDGCDNSCQLVVCGNHLFQCGEECDDGNTASCDGCDASCRLECGNGHVECSESCDDGNTKACDACEPTCQPAECGNGVVDCCEECDDGNTDFGDDCSGDCTFDFLVPQSKDQLQCIDEMNKRGALVARAQNSDDARCLKQAARETLPFAECLGRDLAERVAKAAARTAQADAESCAAASTPVFGYTGAATVNDAATSAPLAMVTELLGAAPVVATQSEKLAMRCQAELMKRAGALFDATWSEANRAKREALRGDRVVSSRQLAGAIDAALASSARLAKTRDAAAKGLAKRCAGVPLDPLVECDVAAPAALAACVIEAATRHAREAIEAADAIDFDLACPPRPLAAQLVTSPTR